MYPNLQCNQRYQNTRDTIFGTNICMLPITVESTVFPRGEARITDANLAISKARRNVAGTRDERTNRSEIRGTISHAIVSVSVNRVPVAGGAAVRPHCTRVARPLRATRRSRVCTRCMPLVTIRDVDIECRARFQRCTTARILVERGKTPDIARSSYFGARIHGFVHTYDAVRLTANRDTVRWRIAFPVEKVIKPASCFVFDHVMDERLLIREDRHALYISSSYLCISVHPCKGIIL